MVSRLTRNQLPGNRLRVRLPCPPPEKVEQNPALSTEDAGVFCFLRHVALSIKNNPKLPKTIKQYQTRTRNQKKMLKWGDF